MRYIASCSFGKDSLATVLLALMHNEPLDEVVYCEVMFDDGMCSHAALSAYLRLPDLEIPSALLEPARGRLLVWRR